MSFVLTAVERALQQAQPEIINSDQGSHFTSPLFLAYWQQRQVRISMDGKGRASSPNGCGGRSNLRTSTCKGISRHVRCAVGWMPTSRFTTTSACINPWATAPQQNSTAPHGDRSVQEQVTFSLRGKEQIHPIAPSVTVLTLGSTI